jgi:UrcA family protein
MSTSPISPAFLTRTVASLAATVSVVLLAFPSPASAQTAPGQTAQAAHVRVELTGKTPDAVRIQIADAARDVCQKVATHSPLFPREVSDCQRETVRLAVAQLSDAPRQMAAR